MRVNMSRERQASSRPSETSSLLTTPSAGSPLFRRKLMAANQKINELSVNPSTSYGNIRQTSKVEAKRKRVDLSLSDKVKGTNIF